MIGVDDLIARFGGLERTELVRWIENRWVIPDEHGGVWQFHEVDIARIELIRHVRREFTVDDDAMSLILSLLDQAYDLRRQLNRVCEALESQPAEIRDAIRRALPPRSRR